MVLDNNTINAGNFCDLTLIEYWEKYRFAIADERGWECKREGCPSSRLGCSKSCANTQQREHVCGTLRTYTRYIHLLQESLGRKSICEISFGDIRNALEDAQGKTGWADETIRTIQSCLSIVFRFAETRGDACNILRYTSYRESQNKDTNVDDLLSLISSKKASADVIQARLQNIREKHIHRTKSLTIWQLERLSQIIQDGMIKDGRYCALAIMLYTGVRPAEARALRWGDLVPFLDHPDHLLMRLYRTLDQKGRPKSTMKTTNAYRSIPVHFELAQLLNDRYQFVLLQLGRGASSLINRRPMDSEVAELPICCLGNNFRRYCRDYEVALLADHVFSQQLRLPQRDMYIYMLDNLIEQQTKRNKTSPEIAEQNQQLTLYVLRRNFWTWLASSTRLSDFEKRYIMGHEMDLDGRSQRSKYNDENRLWTILQKMNRCVLGKELHQAQLYITPVKDQPTFIEDRGLVRFIITKEMLQSGGTLSINITMTEAGDGITIRSLSPVKKLGGLMVTAKIAPYPCVHISEGINCEYENWLAHQSPKRPSTNSSDASNGEDTLSW